MAAGIKGVFRSSTQFAVAIFRTQLFDAGDVGGVRAVQAGFRVQTLSGFTGQPAAQAAPAVGFPKISKDLIRTHFFTYLDFALRFAPAAANEMAIRAQLARIGVGPGAAVRFADLSVTERLEVLVGLQEGEQAVDAAAAASGTMVNGWHIGAPFGDAAHYNGDWLTRAVAARAGIYGNSAEEAVYPLTREDSAGRVLDGKRGAYTLTFAAGQLPPVEAFWSVTLYDAASRLLVRNPIDRYDQFVDAAGAEDECRRVGDAVYSGAGAGGGPAGELAAGAGSALVSGDAGICRKRGRCRSCRPAGARGGRRRWCWRGGAGERRGVRDRGWTVRRWPSRRGGGTKRAGGTNGGKEVYAPIMNAMTDVQGGEP